MAVTPDAPSPARDPRILAEFKGRRRRQLGVSVMAVLGIIGILWLQEQGSGMAAARPLVSSLFLGFIIFLVAFSFYNWRCPACRRYLGRGLGPKFCPGCGVPLQ